MEVRRNLTISYLSDLSIADDEKEGAAIQHKVAEVMKETGKTFAVIPDTCGFEKLQDVVFVDPKLDERFQIDSAGELLFKGDGEEIEKWTVKFPDVGVFTSFFFEVELTARSAPEGLFAQAQLFVVKDDGTRDLLQTQEDSTLCKNWFFQQAYDDQAFKLSVLAVPMNSYRLLSLLKASVRCDEPVSTYLSERETNFFLN